MPSLLSEKQRKFTLLLGKLIKWAYENNYELVIGEVLRTKEQQAIYLKTGASQTSNSKHLVSCAVDVSLFVDGAWVIDPNKVQIQYVIDGDYTADPERYRPLGEYWESLGAQYGVETRWGGRFGVAPEDYDKKIGWDSGHFELA